MGTSFKQRVVAEGVVGPVQLAFLKTKHCEEPPTGGRAIRRAARNRDNRTRQQLTRFARLS